MQHYHAAQDDQRQGDGQRAIDERAADDGKDYPFRLNSLDRFKSQACYNDCMAVQLPFAERAYIDPRKLRDYALNPRHDTGRFKAAFFAQMGYTAEEWQTLEKDIREQLVMQPAELGKASPYGQKYSITAVLNGPNGEGRWVTVVWMIRIGQDLPELITIEPAQPGKEKG